MLCKVCIYIKLITLSEEKPAYDCNKATNIHAYSCYTWPHTYIYLKILTLPSKKSWCLTLNYKLLNKLLKSWEQYNWFFISRWSWILLFRAQLFPHMLSLLKKTIVVCLNRLARFCNIETGLFSIYKNRNRSIKVIFHLVNFYMIFVKTTNFRATQATFHNYSKTFTKFSRP